MQTIYDWLSLICFSGLIVLFLQRSMDGDGKDSILSYLPPALGCAGANYLGNNGYGIVAIAVLVATVAYVVIVLKPLKR